LPLRDHAAVCRGGRAMADKPGGAKSPRQRGLKEPWKAGESGNVKGRPHGSRHAVSLAVEALIDGEHEVLTRKAIQLAKAGDMGALKLCIDRLCPLRRDRHVAFALPKLEKPEDAMAAVVAIAEAVASGELTPSEAAELSRLIDSFKNAVETVSFEARRGRSANRCNDRS
jgi:hypothetical protein